MFRTLRAKLAVSYLLLVCLTLFLSATAAGIVITRVQRRVNLARAQTLALSIARQLRAQPGLPWRAPGLLERLGQEGNQINGRLLVMDESGRVLVDPQGDYEGQRVPLQPPPRVQPEQPPDVRRHRFADGQEYFIIYVPLPKALQERVGGEYLGLAILVQQIDPPWREILRPLVAVGLVVILLAIAIAFLLANSITRPITAMTQATEEMARGNYQQAIRTRGNDEIARLARSFSHMAREVDRAHQSQRDLLANVSHDLKTPLTSIQGFSQAILEGAVTDEKGYRRAAEIIHSEAERMRDLVEDLVDLARLEGGGLDLASEPISISRLVREEIDQARDRAQTIDIVPHMPEDLPPVVGDTHRLHQVVANLLDNALKYGRPGTEIEVDLDHVVDGAQRPPSLDVAFGEPPTEGEWVFLTVTNQGDTIPERDLPRVFDRFYRVDRSRQRSQGSGLGLAIVRETALAHGGRIEVGSHPAQGTRFRVWLPVEGPRPDAEPAS